VCLHTQKGICMHSSEPLVATGQEQPPTDHPSPPPACVETPRVRADAVPAIVPSLALITLHFSTLPMDALLEIWTTGGVHGA
jgi:hypothetical protein